MNDADNAQDHGLTTDQIAGLSAETDQQDVPAQTADEDFDDANHAPIVAGHAAAEYPDRTVPDDVVPDDDVSDDRLSDDRVPDDRVSDDRVPDNGEAADTRASLLEGDELQSMTMRWKDIQAEFVDEPSKAVQEADALVAELMQRLATMFASERAGLEERLAGGQRVSTEDLRQGLRLYRSFFERLLAA